MRKFALDLAAAGIPVFPCGASKAPLTGNGFKDATCEPFIVDLWWSQWPDAQVGIWPGRAEPRLLVIDIDVKNGAPGEANAAALADLLPPTAEQRTPSGGRHLFYRLPAGAAPIGNRVLAPGLDVRSENGYVLVYQPDRLIQGTVSDAPAALLQRLAEAGERADNAHEWLCEPDLPANVERARAWLAETAPAIEGQGGNNWTYATAEILRDFGLSPEGALGLMLEPGGWNERCAPPWSADELKTIIANAYRYAKRPAGSRARDPAAVFAAHIVRPEWTSAVATDFQAKPVRFLWRPYLLCRHLTILGGRGGAGKGLIAAHLAATVTTGGTWPDGERAEAGRVLWCETEDPIEEALIPRLQAAGADLSKVHFANPTLGFDGFARLIREFRPGLLVMSPLVSFLKGLSDIRDELGVRMALEALYPLLVEADTCGLGIGHLNKKSDLSAIERLLGSVAFANFVRSVLLAAAEPDTEDTCRLVHAKHNLSRRGPDWLYRPRHVGEDRDSQHIRLEWTRPEGNADADTLFDKRKREPGTDTALGWLISYLQGAGEVDFKVLVKDAQEAGHTKAAIQKARDRTNRVRVRFSPGFPPATLWRLVEA